ncbi:MAG: glycosyltransferase [Phormidesmis sp.]
MSLEDTRLLIVVEDADYRAPLSNVFMPERLDEQLAGKVSPVDTHILTAAMTWASRMQAVTIFSCYSSEAYAVSTYLGIQLAASGVSAIEANKGGPNINRRLILQVANFCPTRIVMCTRSLDILKWAIRNKIRTVTLFSSWQAPFGWFEKWRHRQLVRSLNRNVVNWVGGCGVQLSRNLAHSGINRGKIIPWEWAQPQLLNQYSPKTMRDHGNAIELVYVGELNEKTGMNDLLKAAIQLRRSGYTVSLQLIRNTLNYTSLVEAGETAWLETQVQALDLADSVTVWAGLTPEQMLSQVRAADVAVIPLPPDQPQQTPPLGVALAMATCTPIVACDHKNLDNHLLHGVNAISFPLGNPKSIAHRIERIMGQSMLYAQLSESSETALATMKVPARWQSLIESWLRDVPYDQQQLSNFALSSGRYQAIEPD